MIDYLGHASDIHSQNGEDGILAKLCEELGIEQGWCCEAGAGDGQTDSNTLLLIQHGWSGVFVENDPDCWTELAKIHQKHSPRLSVYYNRLSPSGDSSLDAMLQYSAIPKGFDILSLDTEGSQYYIWHGLIKYKPKIVVIEVNSHVAPDAPMVNAFLPTVMLGWNKGYEPVCHTGNVIFVRRDLLPKLSLKRDWDDGWEERIERARALFQRRQQ